MFASIAYELKKYQKTATNIVIAIDEGDLYLHPQWQMDFFDSSARLSQAWRQMGVTSSLC